MATSAPSEPAGAAAHLTFFLGDEEYGVPLARVAEIAPDEGVTRVPGAPGLLRGVADVRGVPVAVVDLARKFALPIPAQAHRKSLMVVATDAAGAGSRMAVEVDRMGRVLEVPSQEVEPVPPLSSGIRVEFLLGMVRRDRGFVLLLDLDRVLTSTEEEALTGCMTSVADAAVAGSDEERERSAPAAPAPVRGTRRLVVVEASGLRCGIDAAWIQEVAPWGGITPVPGTPASFHGLHNLRGAMLPVLDLAAAMGRPPFVAGGQAAFLVLDPPDGAGGAAALAVQAVLGISEVGTDEVDVMPAFAFPAPAGLVEGAVLVSGRPTLIVDLPALLGGTGTDARARL